MKKLFYGCFLGGEVLVNVVDFYFAVSDGSFPKYPNPRLFLLPSCVLVASSATEIMPIINNFPMYHSIVHQVMYVQ
jgi:hypothetical protein